jgi:acetyl-CoA carboxylase biotin carboxyl carrier protein
MTDLKTLKELIKLMAANDLVEMDLQSDKERVTLKRRGNDAPGVVHYAPAPVHHAAPAPATAPAVPAASAPAAADSDAGLIAIPSPIVGTFYAAASPDAKPFASVGDKVGPDSVVCIIEAMKVFNEIKAEKSGTIVKILAINGQALEFGQPIFMIKP